MFGFYSQMAKAQLAKKKLNLYEINNFQVRISIRLKKHFYK